MNLAEYLARRATPVVPEQRPTCVRCRKALVTCYCALLKPFASPVPFVILQHPDEARNAIATARMAHLSMTNSTLVVGKDFSADAQVAALLDDPARRNVMLFPSRDALPLEQVLADSPPDDPRALTFWILDAKWDQVPQMLRPSPNVRAIPRAAFTPDRASQFQIRRQPRAACLSTVETVHFVIDLVARQRGLTTREHDSLLEVFRHLVRQQQEFVRPGIPSRHQLAKEARAVRRSSVQSA